MSMLDKFLDKLGSRRSTSRVFNPYRYANPRHNLRLYLEYLLESNRAILAVGEAPGYLGCRHTGIPFTCGRTLVRGGHQLFDAIAPRVRMPEIIHETSATHVWAVLRRYRRLPVLWNAFPFHPHADAQRESNTYSKFERASRRCGSFAKHDFALRTADDYRNRPQGRGSDETFLP
jgi:uracil-DNA glycosylase